MFARWIYTAMLYLLIPAVLLRMIYRGFRNRGYWHRWAERFGFFNAPPLTAPIWIHAVSVGEVRAALPLIRGILRDYPNRSVVVTTMTPTGSDQVTQTLGGRVFHVYLPYDLPDSIRRFLDRVQPRIAVMLETELWPNLIHGCEQRGIPFVIANARLSARSARGYARIRALIGPALRKIARVFAQGPQDARHFARLGVAESRIEITGNIKFDLAIPAAITEQAQLLRYQWGINRPVWIAASTHEGEDEIVLDAFAIILRTLPDCLLVLVPRHPERFNKVATLCERRGLRILRHSANQALRPPDQVYLGDTLGELVMLYACCDVAFVGGSLVRVGGHNMLEPAALGIPVIAGPHLFNFSEISQALRSTDALRVVTNANDFARAVLTLLQDPLQRTSAGEAGRVLVEQNRGGLERLMRGLRPYFDASVD